MSRRICQASLVMLPQSPSTGAVYDVTRLTLLCDTFETMELLLDYGHELRMSLGKISEFEVKKDELKKEFWLKNTADNGWSP